MRFTPLGRDPFARFIVSAVNRPIVRRLIHRFAIVAGLLTADLASAKSVSIVADPRLGAAAQHGLIKLSEALVAKGWQVERVTTIDQTKGDEIIVAVTGGVPEILRSVIGEPVAPGQTPLHPNALPTAKEESPFRPDATGDAQHLSAAVPTVGGDAVAEPQTPPTGPEALVIRRFTYHGKPALLLQGGGEVGLMYAALDTAERVGWSKTDKPRRNSKSADGNSIPADPFSEVVEVAEHPFIQDRELSVYTMNRAYWESRFYDEQYWTRYFDMLAADRFSRFLIIFGYENGGFLAPAYPYFFDTPGYPGVHMVGLTAEEQHRNLAALNRLIELAHERGIAVSLGIWDHIYRAGVQTGGAEWVNDYGNRPVPNTVEGVTADNLNAYTKASLQELLRQVPRLDGLQFRIHEESGLKRDEMDQFWRDVFTEMKKLRPELLLEARAKGTPDSVINTALDLGLNLRVETKYWMEQMGLPFHPMHVNPPDQMNRRHGYADLLRYPQRYKIDWRLWNGGTSRILLWGDPEYIRRYDATTLLYQSPIWDVQEPLATKMEAQRPEMKPFALMPTKYRYYDYEFERYWDFYKLWGRLGYNPQTPSTVWEHEFADRFGAAATDIITGLQRASEVLPMIVTAVYPYRLFPTTRGWAERQTLGTKLSEYATNEGTDTELIESFTDAAKRILAGGATAKRSPEITSQWFDDTADAIMAAVTNAEAKIGSRRGNEFDATVTDLRILAQLARFHARRALAAVHYNLYLDQKANPATAEAAGAELRAATEKEREAVNAWRELVSAAGDRYSFDLAMGARTADLCGHWRDETPKLEADLHELEAACATLPPTQAKPWVPHKPGTPPTIQHERLVTATPGQPIRIVARVADAAGVKSVVVKYRHVTQFENYTTLALQPTGEKDTFAATIPGSAISSQWDFMYFLEAIDAAGNGAIWPDPMRTMPYVVLRTNGEK